MIAPSTRAPVAIVLAALAPGLVVSSAVYGAGALANVVSTIAMAYLVEAAAVAARGREVRVALQDGSVAITGALIGMALPPGAAWPVSATACAAGLLLGKHVYGGHGASPFNPAMVGYVVAYFCFPREMSLWPMPLDVDGVTAATALEVFRHRGALTVQDVWTATNGFGGLGGLGAEWINAAFLAGGMLLVLRRVIDWRIPFGMLAALGVLAALGWDGGSSAGLGSPAMHWLTGGTMLAACFVATDPVTSPDTARGRLLSGALIGTLVFVFRAFGAYPDGIAFAVLLANLAAPLLDRLQPLEARGVR